MAGSTNIWHLASVVHADHADVLLMDIQMCSVRFRSCDHYEDDGMHQWIPNKIKMAAKVRLSFCKFISQILLEYDASVSKEKSFKINIVDIFIQTGGNKESQ